MQEIHCIVKGRVQMVMYRDFVKRGARALEIVGWVKNLSDGTVEVVAQGEKTQLEMLIERLKRGSILSHVDDVHAEWRPSSEHFDSFEIVL
ncbi:MAG: acylphosphatase [Parcubacteria group bacterium]|nr:acylphosphatase [Parcubacteria group bacterium]